MKFFVKKKFSKRKCPTKHRVDLPRTWHTTKEKKVNRNGKQEFWVLLGFSNNFFILKINKNKKNTMKNFGVQFLKTKNQISPYSFVQIY